MAGSKRDLPKTDKGWQAYLSNARLPARRERLSLGGGLVVFREPSGLQTLYGRIRRKGERNPQPVRIGSFPTFSVADARRELVKMKSLAREGRDPALEQRRARAGVVPLRTLNDLIEWRLAEGEGKVAAKTLKIERDLLRVLASVLGDRLLLDLEPIDFGAAFADYAARLKREGRSDGVNANKLFTATRRMFKRARGAGRIAASLDPTVGLSKPAREAPRDRILFDGQVLVGPDPSVNELGRLGAALRAEPSPVPVSRRTRIALMLTMRLGLRALETCSLEWRAVDLDGDPPTASVTRSKTPAGLRTLPLPPSAVEELRELEMAARKGEIYVFPAEPGSRRAQHMHAESLSRAFARACDRLGIAGASTHDLRRTCLSALIELGHEGIARRIAGHAGTDVIDFSL